jgi:hypothetical protein
VILQNVIFQDSVWSFILINTLFHFYLLSFEFRMSHALAVILYYDVSVSSPFCTSSAEILGLTPSPRVTWPCHVSYPLSFLPPPGGLAWKEL